MKITLRVLSLFGVFFFYVCSGDSLEWSIAHCGVCDSLCSRRHPPVCRMILLLYGQKAPGVSAKSCSVVALKGKISDSAAPFVLV